VQCTERSRGFKSRPRKFLHLSITIPTTCGNVPAAMGFEPASSILLEHRIAHLFLYYRMRSAYPIFMNS
jgi:hypothetical protein